MGARSRTRTRSAFGVILLSTAMGFGCGGDGNGDSPGPGGSTITGNVSTASTASAQRARSTWLAWLGENVVGLARTVYAQTTDTSLGGITVIARGDGREVSDLTDSSGGFVIADAPTGDVAVIFRRGACEASLPLGNVLSNSTIVLEDTDFGCPAGSNAGTADAGGIFESFVGVIRNENDPESAVTLCVRQGSDDRDRDVDLSDARLEDENGRSTSFASFRDNDLVQVSGERIGAGDAFEFFADVVSLEDRDVTDQCAIPG
jgi:hypothetical protein